MLMKKATRGEEAGTVLAAIVELVEEDLAHVVAGAGSTANLVDEADMASGGVSYSEMYRHHRRFARHRRLYRHRQSRTSSTAPSTAPSTMSSTTSTSP